MSLYKINQYVFYMYTEKRTVIEYNDTFKLQLILQVLDDVK